MKIRFIRGAEQGEAEYDHSTETYSWSYDGDDSHIIGLLSMLEDGRKFLKMVTDDPDSYPDEDGPYVVNEGYEPLPWDGQIEELSRCLERHDFKVGRFDE